MSKFNNSYQNISPMYHFLKEFSLNDFHQLFQFFEKLQQIENVYFYKN